MPVRIFEIARSLGIKVDRVLQQAHLLGITTAKGPGSSPDKITADFLMESLEGIPTENEETKTPPLPASHAPSSETENAFEDLVHKHMSLNQSLTRYSLFRLCAEDLAGKNGRLNENQRRALWRAVDANQKKSENPSRPLSEVCSTLGCQRRRAFNKKFCRVCIQLSLADDLSSTREELQKKRRRACKTPGCNNIAANLDHYCLYNHSCARGGF